VFICVYGRHNAGRSPPRPIASRSKLSSRIMRRMVQAFRSAVHRARRRAVYCREPFARSREPRRMKKITCFKAYDVRGRVPGELNEDVAYRVGRAYAEFVGARRVAVGRDIRLSSPALAAALTRGLTDSGVDVLDIGLVGTEIVYFATFHEKLDGGIMVTASHNPPDYNGMKMVREESRPISADTGLKEIQAIAERESFRDAGRKGTVEAYDVRPAYIEHLLSYVDREAL